MPERTRLRTARPVLALLLLLLLFFSPLLPAPVCSAAGKNDDPFSSVPNFGSITENGLTWRNSATGFRVVIEDEIDLLSSTEERQLLDDMIPLTEYGNVAFWSTRESASDELVQAEQRRRGLFDLESASILAINMNLRTVAIQSYGTLYDVITSSRANSITNNVRNDLTRGQYYAASSKAFSQMESLMRGNRIAQPMKLLSNICISLMIGLMLMLGQVFRYASTFRKPNQPQIIGATALALTAVTVARNGARQTYSPLSSDDSDDDDDSGGGSRSSYSSSYSGSSSSYSGSSSSYSGSSSSYTGGGGSSHF